MWVCHLFTIHRYDMLGCLLMSDVSRPVLPIDLTVIWLFAFEGVGVFGGVRRVVAG